VPWALPVFADGGSYNFLFSGGPELGTLVVIEVVRFSGIFRSS